MTRGSCERLPVLVVDAHPIVANAIGRALTDLNDRIDVTVCHTVRAVR